MSVPDAVGFRLIEKAVDKYRGHGTISMVYAELYEAIESNDHKVIDPGNYIMYIDKDYIHESMDYKLIVIKNGTKYYCSIYEILKTSLVEKL